MRTVTHVTNHLEVTAREDGSVELTADDGGVSVVSSTLTRAEVAELIAALALALVDL